MERVGRDDMEEPYLEQHASTVRAHWNTTEVETREGNVDRQS